MTPDLLARLPFPLAQVYLKARNAKSAAERHHNAYYALEALLKLMGAVGTRVYAGLEVRNERVDQALQPFSMPSVGHWVQIVRELCACFSEVAERADEEGDAIWQRFGSLSQRRGGLPNCLLLARTIAEQDGITLGFGERISPLDLFDVLPPYRNRHLGHGGVATEYYYLRLYPLLKGAFEELFEQVEPMAGGELVIVEERREVGAREMVAERILFTGNTPMRMEPLAGPAEHMRVWETGKLYLVRPGHFPLPLFPFMHGIYGEERADIFFLNRCLKGGSAEFLSYGSGQVIKSEGFREEISEFVEWIGGARKRHPDVPGPAGLPAVAPTAAAPSAEPKRRAVAVLGFRNLTGSPESAWISTALAEMLTTEVAAGEQVRTIPGENVARTKIQLSLAEAESYSPETLAWIRAHLGCDLVVLGSYLAMGGGQIRLDLRIQDAREGITRASLAETGSVAEFLDFVSRAGSRLREKLGIEALSAFQAAEVQAALPANSEVARLYAEGLDHLRFFRALEAKGLFERAVAGDPGHALAHSALSAAWSALGYDERALEEARKAFDLAGGLSRQDRLAVEGQYLEAAREWGKAIEVYRTLYTFFPDHVDYALRLAHAQTSSGRTADALETLASLRELPAPDGEDPRIDLAAARSAQSRGDWKACLDFASAAAAKGGAQDAGLIVATAHFLQSFALGHLGDLRSAKDAAADARARFEAAGDLGGAADALNAAALILWRQGDLGGAEGFFGRALETYQRIGKKRGEASALHNLVLVHRSRGDLKAAAAKAQDALLIWREIGSRKGIADSLNNAACLLREQGQLGPAREMLEEALALMAELGNRPGEAHTVTNLGLVYAEQGDFGRSRDAHETAVAIFREAGCKADGAGSLLNLGLALMNLGDLPAAGERFAACLSEFAEIGERSGHAYALHYLGILALETGELAEARKALEAALSIRKELGEKITVALSLVDLGTERREEGKAAEALDAAEKALAEFRSIDAWEEEATALHLRAGALLDLGRVEEAREALAQSRELLKRGDHAHFSAAVLVAESELVIRFGGEAERARSLEALRAAWKDVGATVPFPLSLRLRLALGRLEALAGDEAAGRAILDELRGEAERKGFHLLARKAER